MAAIVRRSPVHDAPPYDPTLWEGDRFFLTRRVEWEQMQKYVQRGQQAVESVTGEAAAEKERKRIEEGIAAHLLPSPPRKRWWRRWAEAVIGAPEKKPPPKINLGELSLDEITNRFQTAVETGDEALTGLLARELARRKAKIVQKQEVASAPGTSAAVMATSSGALTGMIFATPSSTLSYPAPLHTPHIFRHA